MPSNNDLADIISGLGGNEIPTPPIKESPSKEIAKNSDNADNNLWTAFKQQIDKDAKRTNRSTNLIPIDPDLVETFRQCDLKCATWVSINSIIRVFLEANLDKLKEYRVTPTKSLFDKSEKSNTQ